MPPKHHPTLPQRDLQILREYFLSHKITDLLTLLISRIPYEQQRNMVTHLKRGDSLKKQEAEQVA